MIKNKSVVSFDHQRVAVYQANVFISKICIIFFSANALSCYQCSSVNDTECHDLSSHRPHLTVGFFKECNDFGKYGGLQPFCRKTVVESVYLFIEELFL